MNNATVALALQLVDLPDKRQFSHHVIFLTKDGEEGEPVETLENNVRFELDEPGTYIATASSIADDGSVLTGPFVSEPRTITAPARPRGVIVQAELVQSITINLEQDDMDTQNPNGRTGNPNDPVDMARHPDADVPIGGKLSNGETQTETTKAAIAQAAMGAYSSQGNAAGHADQAEVARDAATKVTDDGTATTGPSDSH